MDEGWHPSCTTGHDGQGVPDSRCGSRGAIDLYLERCRRAVTLRGEATPVSLTGDGMTSKVVPLVDMEGARVFTLQERPRKYLNQE